MYVQSAPEDAHQQLVAWRPMSQRRSSNRQQQQHLHEPCCKTTDMAKPSLHLPSGPMSNDLAAQARPRASCEPPQPATRAHRKHEPSTRSSNTAFIANRRSTKRGHDNKQQDVQSHASSSSLHLLPTGPEPLPPA
ncbi:uncharacterized protein VDAG_06833 [Verticillium dahliae VdLs.17]|uniref:Uncharacterized protein n=1 Tax=Verticillium dahliae (strain VdLs.17 / ATCC MYA-4575 / FGSC 10137) TaxID=498257 RepID=G2X9K1_VERDV|nr:uncharacterized protein VDAG_06833 [Verticillium dahliae VdLs.17]EGY15669.1 hypothetical protein VDAG_06833 [Verticillium dahliae VdLs.17]